MRRQPWLLGVVSAFVLSGGPTAAPPATQISIGVAAAVAAIGATWATPAFLAGEFTGNNAMTWTVEPGDIITDAYVRIGNTVTYNLVVFATTIGGTPSTVLQRDLPAELVSTTSAIGVCDIADGTLRDVGVVFAAGTRLRISHGAIAAFSAATNAVSLSCSITFEVNS